MEAHMTEEQMLSEIKRLRGENGKLVALLDKEYLAKLEAIHLLDKCRAQLSDAQGRVSELTDLLDLAHDDFQRVEALTDDTELRGIALRGQAKIRQNVPVIRQRDELENSVIKLNGLNDQLRAQLSDVTAQYKHCHNLYSERIECTNKLGRKVESLQAQLSDAQAALKVSKEAMETINRIERSLNGSPWKTLSEGIDACTAALKPRRE
jgi:uncharacterized phage infection (PIP) family protein YhgE